MLSFSSFAARSCRRYSPDSVSRFVRTSFLCCSSCADAGNASHSCRQTSHCLWQSSLSSSYFFSSSDILQKSSLLSCRVIDLADNLPVLHQIIHISANGNPGKIYFAGNLIAAEKNSFVFFQIRTNQFQSLFLHTFFQKCFWRIGCTLYQQTVNFRLIQFFILSGNNFHVIN